MFSGNTGIFHLKGSESGSNGDFVDGQINNEDNADGDSGKENATDSEDKNHKGRDKHQPPHAQCELRAKQKIAGFIAYLSSEIGGAKSMEAINTTINRVNRILTCIYPAGS